jgi:ubiquinone biosynthesis protein COQ9
MEKKKNLNFMEAISKVSIIKLVFFLFIIVSLDFCFEVLFFAHDLSVLIKQNIISFSEKGPKEEFVIDNLLPCLKTMPFNGCSEKVIKKAKEDYGVEFSKDVVSLINGLTPIGVNKEIKFVFDNYQNCKKNDVFFLNKEKKVKNFNRINFCKASALKKAKEQGDYFQSQVELIINAIETNTLATTKVGNQLMPPEKMNELANKYFFLRGVDFQLLNSATLPTLIK